MLKFDKESLIRKMDGYTSVAQVAIFQSLKEDYEKNMGSYDTTLFAAAVANYLFGRTADPDHVEQFTLVKIRAAGNQILADNHSIRKLVVQSLRVLSTITIAIGKGEIDTEILSIYGIEFPDAPDPSSYLALINESIQAMSPSVQESISKLNAI